MYSTQQRIDHRSPPTLGTLCTLESDRLIAVNVIPGRSCVGRWAEARVVVGGRRALDVYSSVM